MFHIVLVEPEIPSNTGNIARTCVAMNCHLHLVGPLGFSIDEKQVRRAGLDYWPYLKLSQYKSWSEFTNQHDNTQLQRVYFSTKAHKTLFDYEFHQDSWLVFGPETRGLRQELIETHRDQLVKIPMIGEVRSLNLSNAVAIGIYEAFRQVKRR